MSSTANPLPQVTDYDICRFWHWVDRREEDECWPWTGEIGRDGYGRFSIKNNNVRPHRLAMFLDSGVDPFPLFALHKCDNPRCVNPKHLFGGTVKDNHADMVAKGRSLKGERNIAYMHPELVPRGPGHGMSKMNEKAVRVARQLRHDGLTFTQIAEAVNTSFGLSVGWATIQYCINRGGWGHVR